MDMDREPLGDIPDLKEYQVPNTVTAIVRDRLVEWTVGFGDHLPFGHVYGWRLTRWATTRRTSPTTATGPTSLMRCGRRCPSPSFLSGCWNDPSRTSTGSPPPGGHRFRPTSSSRATGYAFGGTEWVVPRIEHPFLVRAEMLAFIEDTPDRWLKRRCRWTVRWKRVLPADPWPPALVPAIAVG